MVIFNNLPYINIYVLKYCTGFSKPHQKYNKQTHKVPRTVIRLNNLNL